MSKLLVCAVQDNKVGAFAAPFLARTKGEAIRSFSLACEDATLPFKKSPKDYTLYVIGEFQEETGGLVGVTPERLLAADEVQ